MKAATGREERRLRIAQPVAWVMAMLLAITLIGPAPARALGFPGRQRGDTAVRTAGLGSPRQGSLLEVAPPPAVQELRQALADHEPRVRIVSPANDSLLPAGPWTLHLEVEDWPLVDAGPLGLGPHLVAQLDDRPAIPLTGTEAEMPALSPGSHRLTVYAARPWGEAVKSPGAYRQIRLHRLAANPLTVPAPGSPQLIPVQPDSAPVQEPVLLDWLLLDAPLQRLRGEGTEGWRLRVSVNGDSFLVDQQTPLWLSGWRQGENALQLELVDGRGEPLNAPFNAVVAGVNVSRSTTAPRWLGAALDPLEKARLLGEAPPETEEAAAVAAPPEEERSAEPLAELAAQAMPEPEAMDSQENAPANDDEGVADNHPDSAIDDDSPEPVAEESAQAQLPQPSTSAESTGLLTPDTTPETTAPVAAASDDTPPVADMQTPPPPPPGSPSAPRLSNSDLPPARTQVNPDGTLIRPAPQGPLTRLRERLNR